jgi:hypothetical protein
MLSPLELDLGLLIFKISINSKCSVSTISNFASTSSLHHVPYLSSPFKCVIGHISLHGVRKLRYFLGDTMLLSWNLLKPNIIEGRRRLEKMEQLGLS